MGLHYILMHQGRCTRRRLELGINLLRLFPSNDDDDVDPMAFSTTQTTINNMNVIEGSYHQ